MQSGIFKFFPNIRMIRSSSPSHLIPGQFQNNPGAFIRTGIPAPLAFLPQIKVTEMGTGPAEPFLTEETALGMANCALSHAVRMASALKSLPSVQTIKSASSRLSPRMVMLSPGKVGSCWLVIMGASELTLIVNSGKSIPQGCTVHPGGPSGINPGSGNGNVTAHRGCIATTEMINSGIKELFFHSNWGVMLENFI